MRRYRLIRFVTPLALSVLSAGMQAAETGWNRLLGSHDYSDPANWVGGLINNIFHSSLVLENSLYLRFPAGYATTGDLQFSYQQGSDTYSVFIAPASARQTLTLGGDVHFTPQESRPGSRPALFFGDIYAQDIDLGGISREIEVGAGSFVRTDDDGVISNGGILKTGGGELLIQGVNTFREGVEVRAGRLTYQGSGALGTGLLAFTGPAELASDGGGPILNATRISAELTLTGDHSISHSGAVNLAGQTRTISLGFESVGLAGIFSGVISNGAMAIKSVEGSGGTLVLSGDNSYAGGTTVTGASLALAHKNALGSGGLVLNEGAQIGSFGTFGGPVGADAVPNPVTITGNITTGVTFGGAQQLEFSGPIDLGSATRTITTLNQEVILSGTVSGGPGVGLIIEGLGALSLPRPNTFDGGLMLRGGSLRFGDPESVGSGTLTLAGGFLTFGGLQYTGVNAIDNPVALRGDVSIVGTVELIGPIDLGSSASRLRNSGGTPITLAGVISGSPSGSLTLAGSSGEFIIMNANTYTGGTVLEGPTVSGPRVRLGNKAALGTGPVQITGDVNLRADVALIGINAIANSVTVGANFTFGTTQPLELAGPINLANGNRLITMSNSAGVTLSGGVAGGGSNGALTVEGSGRLTLSGLSSYTGPTTVRGGSVLVPISAPAGAPGPLGSAMTAVTLGHTNSGAGAALLTAGPVTIGRNVIIASGLRTVTLGGFTADASTFSGNISVNRAVTLAAVAGGTVRFAGTISGGNHTITKGSAGTVILENANVYTGATTVAAGALLVNNTTGSGTGSGSVAVTAGELGGRGFISGSVSVGNGTGTADAVLSPGDGIGSLRTGALAFLSDGAFKFELNSTLQESDQVFASGAVSLGNAVFSGVDFGSATLPEDFRFVLIENTSSASTTGQFFNLSEQNPVQIGQNHFVIEYDAAIGVDALANDVVARVVPEPGTATLLGFAAAIAIGRRRRPRP